MMTKKSRTILFAVCAFFFLLASPLVILYSQGYRFDFKNKRVAKTGAVYLKVMPKSAEVSIDGKLKKKTDLIFGSAFIENLVPGSYSVEVKKLGFSSWVKNLEINPGQATEVRNVLLFPAFEPPQAILDKIEDISFAPDNKKVVLKKTDTQGWYLTLFNQRGNIEEILVREKNIDKKNAVLLSSILWSNDSQKIILNTGVNESPKSYLLDLAQKPVLPISLDYLNNPEKIEFQADDSGKILILKEGGLFINELPLKKRSLLYDNVVDFKSTDKGIYVLEGTGNIIKIEETALLKKQEITAVPLELKQEVAYKVENLKGNLFLFEQDTLFQFDQETKALEKIAESVKDIEISPDNKKLAYSNNEGEILVIFLQEQLEQPLRKKGEKVFLARFSQNPENIFWLNGNYLIFSAGEQIKIAEIDNRGSLNIYELASFPSPEFSFDKTDKKIFLFSQGKFLVLDNFFPY